MDLLTLAGALQTGALSASESVSSCLARLDAVNPAINAVVARDDSAALARARALDDAFVRSGPVGPLHGVPFTVKDWIDAAGLPAAWRGVAGPRPAAGVRPRAGDRPTTLRVGELARRPHGDRPG